MALMAAAGEITPMPKAAIFADTQAEPASVYKWLDWLEKQLPFPVIRVTKGNLRTASLGIHTSRKSGNTYLKGLIPAFVVNPDGSMGLLGRKCTADYKVDQIVRASRSLCDWKRGEKRHLITMWIGISRDEILRMKDSRHAFIKNQWPLVDKKMTREGCLTWMKYRGFPIPPRSACTFCPFHSDEEWRRLRDNEPEEFASVVAYELELQAAQRNQEALKGIPFLHESGKPINEVDFGSLPSHTQTNLFQNECEGMCGV